MDRGSSAEPLSWLIVPTAAVLVASALTLPLQPYTGLVLRDRVVMAVDRLSPGANAGFQAGDRLEGVSPIATGLQGPLADARPGQRVELTRERGGRREDVWLMPSAMPTGERRMMAALLALASGFVLLGGWVWSERRDRLTRPFHVLCLAFATVLAPIPRLPWPAARSIHELLYTAATLFLPACCIHFFALFPESRAVVARMGTGVRFAYGAALGLWLSYVAIGAAQLLGLGPPDVATAVLEAAAAIWFAAGLLVAVVLFALSYARARALDARRRMRVALAGTALGLAPLAAVTVLRNLAPGVTVPGERLAVVLTLLVPLSLAWAIAVHRIFDFRIALRGGLVVSGLSLVGAALIVGGDLLTASRATGPDLGAIALAIVALGCAVVGPARPTLRSAAGALLPLHGEDPMVERLVADLSGRSLDREELLRRASGILATALRLESCAALDFHLGSRSRTNGGVGLGEALTTALAGRSGPIAMEDLTLPHSEREALEARGASWLLPVGEELAAALLLGRRLAGPWLDQREINSLARCGQQLALMLENVSLRDGARSRVSLDRELERAAALQAHLLPRRAPLYATLDCAAATWSSGAVGGDYYDFVERPDRGFTLVVGDAAGHGVPAALLLAGVQAGFRSEASRDVEPGALLGSLNAELARQDHPDRFVGLLCARVEVDRGRLHVANAGLVPPLVRRRDGRWQELTAGGLLLGVRPDSWYPDARVDLGAGDVAVICTDGLTEARRGDDLFGPERVCEVVDRCCHRRAADILAEVIAAVRAFAEGPLDDLTLVVLKQLTDPAPAVRRRTNGDLKSTVQIADSWG